MLTTARNRNGTEIESVYFRRDAASDRYLGPFDKTSRLW